MLLWIIATLCAYFVKGLCGFANTLVFTTVLSFSSSNALISPVELLLGFPTNAILAWHERASLERRVWLPLAALVVAGSIPGAIFLKNADTNAVKILFGVVIVAVGLEMLLRELRPRHGRGSGLILTLIGLLSGLLCGLYGVGALLSAYIGRVTRDSHAFKANMCMVFVVENALRAGMYAALGILTVDVVRSALPLFPFMLAGLLLGMRSGSLLNERTVRRLVIVALIISGAALIVNSL